MFLIPTFVAPSRTHGVGVFTPFPIPAGTLIWTFTDHVDLRISPSDLEGTPEPLRERLRRYCYREESGTYVLCTDNAKFMNHSFSPNCDDSGETGTVTLRDIAAGEELTCDYRTFDLDSRDGDLSAWQEAEERAGDAPRAGARAGTDLAPSEG